MIFLAIILVLSSSLLLISIMSMRRLVAQFLSIYLLCFTNIALTLQIANLFRVMNQPAVILGFHTVILLILIAIWNYRNKPDPLLPFKHLISCITEIKTQKPTIKEIYLPILAFVSGLVYLFNAFLVVYVPPNNVDSLSTHMSRVGFWLQRGSYFPWSTPRIWQITYPVNAQLQMFWSVLFTRGDRLAGFTQWAAALASALAVIGLARLLKATRFQALFAGLVFLSLPAIVLQSTTTQNDLVICALFVIAVYFFFLSFQDSDRYSLVLSGHHLFMRIVCIVFRDTSHFSAHIVLRLSFWYWHPPQKKTPIF